jgi:hypothetical protein
MTREISAAFLIRPWEAASSDALDETDNGEMTD